MGGRRTLERGVHSIVRGPLALAGGGGESGSGRAGWRGAEMVDQDKDRGMLFSGPRARARVTLDHALGSKESLDLLAQLGDAVVLLRCIEGRA